ncbi:uncharacterized protein LOC112270138 [Brachypodium distachyon]|uniref:uncharacterized protein LOC112270138 n=1 Tax=Brachypodium distachyon TaxID=15368 RepID=UPI0005300618|nr:uncharacterized protein LOC112270138 [Brachypodium distachyon]|eukprot:XP_024313666.1 uncharacterized protein LOC112270138 [Brachypodium distachyon]
MFTPTELLVPNDTWRNLYHRDAELLPIVAKKDPAALKPGAGAVVVDLGPDAEDTERKVEPKAAPAPISTAPDTTVVAPAAATGAELDGAPPATEAAGADPAAIQRETGPAEGAAMPSVPQPTGAGTGEAAAEEQQGVLPQVGDAPPSQTVAAGASSSSTATFSPDVGTLAGGHQSLDAIKEQQLAFVTSFNQVKERHELAKGQLSEVRQAVERERQELSWLREETRLARDAVAAPVVPEVGLHAKLEEQTKAVADAATAAARQEKELNSAKERSARLESERATVWEDLIKAGEDNAAKATQIARQADLLRKYKHAVVTAHANHATLVE